MIANMQDGYVLVKDKDGELKYYKDGQFFPIAEIEKQRQASKPTIEKQKDAVELKPAYGFDTRKKQVEAVEPAISKVPEKKETQEEIKKEVNAEIPASHRKPIFPNKVKPEDLEMEEIKAHEESHTRRNKDQDLVQTKVDEVIKRLKVTFSDPNTEKRFKNILLTYFRGIRKEKELAYVLTLPKISGGMELDDKKTQVILSVLRHYVEELEKERRNLHSKPIDDIQSITAMDHQLQPPPPVVVPKNLVTSQVEQTRVRARMMPTPAIQRPVVTTLKSKKAEKPIIADIKRRRLIGPIEELEIMNVENLRRLGENEKEIMDEVLEKIQILAEQSLLKKIEGIKAWKLSPIYRLYLQMTYEAISNKRTIADIIEERQIKNQESLTLSEYEMIGKLNSKLSLS